MSTGASSSEKDAPKTPDEIRDAFRLLPTVLKLLRHVEDPNLNYEDNADEDGKEVKGAAATERAAIELVQKLNACGSLLSTLPGLDESIKEKKRVEADLRRTLERKQELVRRFGLESVPKPETKDATAGGAGVDGSSPD